LKTSKDETVTAKIGNTGSSEMTTKEPQDRQEASGRSARDIAIDFLKVQEEALSAEPLPLSRREHVLRYFTALRKQLETSPASGADAAGGNAAGGDAAGGDSSGK